MEELKLRAWDKVEKKMVKVFQWNSGNIHENPELLAQITI